MTSVNNDLHTRDPVPDGEWSYGGKKAAMQINLLDDIAPIVIPENPPWLNLKPIFNF
jgi:hypothetical protein